MPKTVLNHKFVIDQVVFHKLGEMEKGIVIDIQFTLGQKQPSYLVSFGPEAANDWYIESELSATPIFYNEN